METIILLYEQEHKRIRYGMEQLCDTMEKWGYRVEMMKLPEA